MLGFHPISTQPISALEAAAGGDTIIDLTTASFAFTAQGIQPRLLATMASAVLAFTAQAIQNRLVVSLTTATLNFVAQAVTIFAAMRIDLTAAVLTFTAQATQNRLVIVLSSALLNFTALVIEVTGEVAAAGEDWLVRLRLRRRR